MTSETSVRLDSQIPFFCGDSVTCRSLGRWEATADTSIITGSREALALAMSNINKHFVVVGLLEEVPHTPIPMSS